MRPREHTQRVTRKEQTQTRTRRRTESAQRLGVNERGAGRVGVEVDFAGIAAVEEAAARAGNVRFTCTVRLPDGRRRGLTCRSNEDLGVPRRAGIGVGRAENVLGCTRTRACASTHRVVVECPPPSGPGSNSGALVEYPWVQREYYREIPVEYAAVGAHPCVKCVRLICIRDPAYASTP
jgi:hypothetical protein